MKYWSGTVMQSGLKIQPGDYGHRRIAYPVLGIVLSVHYADDKNNFSGNYSHDFQASNLEARVLVVNHGQDTPWIVPNAVILPSGVSGIDNFSEEIPRPASTTIDGSRMQTGLRNLDWRKLDGDWCVVSFIGGVITQPYIERWWPHPANNRDAATKGLNETGFPVQGPRLVKRFQGTRFSWTSKGSLFLDTSQAGAKFIPTREGNAKSNRKETAAGGSVDLTIKRGQKVNIDFNPPVIREDEPDLLDNTLKKGPLSQAPRETSSTRMTLDEDTIDLIAGKVVQIIAQSDIMDLIAEKAVRLISNSESVTIEANGGDFNAKGSANVNVEAAGGNALVKAAVHAALDAPKTALSLSSPGTPLTDGVVLASGIDTLTGFSYGLLGNASGVVTAKK